MKAPGRVQAAFDQVKDALTKRVAKDENENNITQAIRQLQAVVQMLFGTRSKTDCDFGEYRRKLERVLYS
jgi:hypothetical protein